jgi:hypothetical protein
MSFFITHKNHDNMKKETDLTLGEDIIKQITQWDHRQRMADALALAGVKNRKYVTMEVPIALLRRLDRELDLWFREPTAMLDPRPYPPPVSTLLPAEHEPILMGTKYMGIAKLENTVIDGFYRIAQALLAGKESINAYLPDDSQLIPYLKALPLTLRPKNELLSFQALGIENITCMHSTEKQQMQLFLYVTLNDGKFREEAVPINLLCEHDPQLSRWLRSEEAWNAEPLFAGYTPILIGVCPPLGTEPLHNFLVDGYSRVAGAMVCGHDRIRAYVPLEGPLMKKLKNASKKKTPTIKQMAMNENMKQTDLSVDSYLLDVATEILHRVIACSVHQQMVEHGPADADQPRLTTLRQTADEARALLDKGIAPTNDDLQQVIDRYGALLKEWTIS